MTAHSTKDLLQILTTIDTVGALEQYTSAAASQIASKTFPDFILEQMDRRSMTAAALIREANIGRTYGYQILNGSRHPGRDKVIALCLALKLSLEDVQRALTLAEEQILYPKKIRDSILIFCIHQGLSVFETNDLLFEFEQPILN